MGFVIFLFTFTFGSFFTIKPSEFNPSKKENQVQAAAGGSFNCNDSSC